MNIEEYEAKLTKARELYKHDQELIESLKKELSECQQEITQLREANRLLKKTLEDTYLINKTQSEQNKITHSIPVIKEPQHTQLFNLQKGEFTI